MPDKQNGWGWVQTLAAVIAVFVGVGNLAFLAVNWGVMAEKVRQNEIRIATIESGGSTSAREHIKLDDERVADLRRRLDAVENALTSISKIESRLASFEAKIDQLIKERDGKKTAVRWFGDMRIDAPTDTNVFVWPN